MSRQQSIPTNLAAQVLFGLLRASALLLILFGMVLVNSAQAGKIVANNDEWTLSNTGYTQSPDAATFATNVVDWFTGGGPANLLAYSSNMGLTGSSLASTMTGAGHTWTVNTSETWTLANLSSYDAIFVGGVAVPSTSVLVDYVNGGGNVYLMGGTGTMGSSATEAAHWNGFLNPFGLSMASSYNGISGNIAISSPHPIFAGVSSLYQNNGSTISDLDLGDPSQAIVFAYSNGAGLYGVYVPEPSSLALGLMGLLGLVGLVWRRRG